MNRAMGHSSTNMLKAGTYMAYFSTQSLDQAGERTCTWWWTHRKKWLIWSSDHWLLNKNGVSAAITWNKGNHMDCPSSLRRPATMEDVEIKTVIGLVLLGILPTTGTNIGMPPTATVHLKATTSTRWAKAFSYPRCWIWRKQMGLRLLEVSPILDIPKSKWIYSR